ncbi:MAG: Rubrerythrin [Syntrophorhabdus sp. PtaB.Bin047]|jgi:rubrerythrin|nr:MAG: Rubrerythrin [Syntrophorhabdus sp. PtaB.Bin047]
MNIFSTGDILQFAVRIEEDGEMFYHKAALNATDKEVRDLFNYLADEEIRHKRIFQDMLSGIETNPPAESFSGEYGAYLRDYVDGKAVFTKDARTEAMSDALDTPSALHFAMGREADSILYYHEAKQFVDEKHYAAIDRIIQEERKHFHKLAQMKAKVQVIGNR